ncbi:MAG: GSCFA domain-containing protein [Salibacteraceae bacterium]
MDHFRTEVTAPEFPFSVDHQSIIAMIGSCFAENIGDRFRQHKIDAHINPFGILFNPFSIMNALERMLNSRPYQENELIAFNERFVSLDHHGKFSHSTASETLNSINKSLEEGRAQLLKSEVVFITLGSAWVYEYSERGHIVANCHKIPNKAFKKRLLSFQETHLILRHIPQFLASKGITANIVFTVSPVRHWKDGAAENQRSKSHLLSAVHEVVDEFEACHYFPSYEFMMDDLRDYRFYKSDMLHPSDQALDYIWEKVQQSFFSDETRIICQELKAVTQAATHRPIDPESNSFQRFLKKQINIIDVLEQKYPRIDLSKERKHFLSFQL